MGTWGAGLYDNDTTADVQDTYMRFLKEQFSNNEAYEKTLEEFQDLIGDEDEEPLLWYALAETQWKVGRLMPDVKEKALTWIAKGGGLALWEESDSGSGGWKKTLDKLKATLESPMCPEKKIRKPKAVNKSFWKVGDVYAYRFHKEESKENGLCGKYILIQKAGEGREDEQWELAPLLMRIHIFDKVFDNMPSLNDMDGVRLLPIGKPRANGQLNMTILMDYIKKKNFPAEHCYYLGNTFVVNSKTPEEKGEAFFWEYIEKTFYFYFTKWNSLEYEVLEGGIYLYKK